MSTYELEEKLRLILQSYSGKVITLFLLKKIYEDVLYAYEIAHYKKQVPSVPNIKCSVDNNPPVCINQNHIHLDINPIYVGVSGHGYKINTRCYHDVQTDTDTCSDFPPGPY